MKFSVSVFLFSVLFLLGGCGYKIGFLKHPQISSAAVAPVTNETLLYNASATLRALLCERIMNDGTYKLQREDQADCIIHTKVRKASFSEISWNSDDDENGEFLPNHYRVSVELEYAVIMPVKVKPIIGPAKVTGEAMFDNMIDLETARRNGVKQALWDGSKKIVDAMTEAW